MSSLDSDGPAEDPPVDRHRDSQGAGPPATTRLGRLGQYIFRPPARPDPIAKAVNKLDSREFRLSLAAVVLSLGLVIDSYVVDRHSHVEKVRTGSTDLFVAGLVIVAVMILGVIFRRRALVGFASFMAGFEMFSGGQILGIVFLFFGGWLLIRALRRQREDREKRQPATTTSRRAPPPPKPAGAPKQSKRYTPPRRSRAAARRR